MTRLILPIFVSLALCDPSLAAAQQRPPPPVSTLSEKPSESATASEFEAQTSTIEPRLDISYQVVAEAANAAADRFAGPRSGRSRIGCLDGGTSSSPPAPKVAASNGCVDFDWHVTAARNGRISVKRDGAGIAVAVPVKFVGNGGFAGDIAKTIQINNKNFAGSFVVSISGGVHLDKNYCPKIEASSTRFAWNSPVSVDVIGKSCLDMGRGLKACVGPWKLPVGDLFTDQINRSLAAQVGEINKKIPCDKIREQLKQVWKTWSIPVPLRNSSSFYVNIEPKSLAIPGVTAGDSSLTIIGRLDAATSVSTTSVSQLKQAALPQNVPLTSPAGRFSLAVPLAIPYPVLASAGAPNLLGKPIKTQSGRAAITPAAVEFFPSNGTLAIGVTIRADAPRLVRKSGVVWFTASPTIDNNGHLIRLGNPAMTRKKRNPLWPLVGDAIEGGLSKAIAASYSYDLAPLVQDAVSKLNLALADPKKFGGLKVTVANADMRLGQTAFLPQAFVVEGRFGADVSATLGKP